MTRIREEEEVSKVYNSMLGKMVNLTESLKVSRSFSGGVFTAAIIFPADFQWQQKFGGSRYSAVARKSSYLFLLK